VYISARRRLHWIRNKQRFIYQLFILSSAKDITLSCVIYQVFESLCCVVQEGFSLAIMFAFDRVRLGLGMSWRVQVMLFCLLLVCVDHGVMGLRSASGMRNLLDDIPDPDTVLGCGPGGGSTCIVEFKGNNPKKMCNECKFTVCIARSC
jgi:hypothetical protein